MLTSTGSCGGCTTSRPSWVADPDPDLLPDPICCCCLWRMLEGGWPATEAADTSRARQSGKGTDTPTEAIRAMQSSWSCLTQDYMVELGFGWGATVAKIGCMRSIRVLDLHAYLRLDRQDRNRGAPAPRGMSAALDTGGSQDLDGGGRHKRGGGRGSPPSPGGGNRVRRARRDGPRSPDDRDDVADLTSIGVRVLTFTVRPKFPKFTHTNISKTSSSSNKS